jgi:hypothetical protein
LFINFNIFFLLQEKQNYQPINLKTSFHNRISVDEKSIIDQGDKKLNHITIALGLESLIFKLNYKIIFIKRVKDKKDKKLNVKF